MKSSALAWSRPLKPAAADLLVYDVYISFFLRVIELLSRMVSLVDDFLDLLTRFRDEA